MAACLMLGFWLPGHLSVTLTPSLGYRVFFLARPTTANFREGDYLLFHKQLPLAPTDRLLKKVGCAAGHNLTVSNGDYFCEADYLGHALPQDTKGTALPRFIFNGSVPAGRLFMVGTHPRSYDSRYFGFIHVGDVDKKAYPLW